MSPYYAISLQLLKVLSAQREHFPQPPSPFTYRPLPHQGGSALPAFQRVIPSGDYKVLQA